MDDHSPEKQPICWMDSADPQAFFYHAVKNAQTRQSIRLSENVEFYLIQLLCSFIRANTHNSIDDCLVLLLKKALESLPNEKIILYKKIGDTSLYVCGLYQDYFANKSFDIKYYIGMGVSAYENLSTLMSGKTTYQNTMSQIYHEMSESFLDSIDILLCVADNIHTGAKKRRAILNIYDSWMSTESKKLAKDLLNEGIIPLPAGAKKMQ